MGLSSSFSATLPASRSVMGLLVLLVMAVTPFLQEG